MGIGLSDSGLVELNRRHPNVSILKAEGAVLTVARLAEAAAGAFTLFNGRNGMELLDSLRAGCAGLIPGVETCEVQSRIYELHRAGDAEAADEAVKEVLTLLHFLMRSIDNQMRMEERRAGEEGVRKGRTG